MILALFKPYTVHVKWQNPLVVHPCQRMDEIDS